jgi:hypothetical protein
MTLPNFLIVGAMKSGTTSLANWIGAHPEAFVPPGKEIHFFDVDEHWALGLDWYGEIFASAGDAVAVGEATPRYIFLARAVQRMAETVPDAKVIVCLRDPIARARSHWLHAYYRAGVERRSFEQAVHDELAQPEGVECESVAGGYLARGHYTRQLERLEHHYPRERIHVILFEDLVRDPAGAFSEVCAYLGIAADQQPDNLGSRDNAAVVYRPLRLWRFMRRHKLLDRMHPRLAWRIERTMKHRLPKPAPLQPELRSRLAEHFAPHNAALAAWLGRDLDIWAGPS